MFGQARKIVDFIWVAHDVVEFEGFGLEDALHFAGCRFVSLRLLFPLGPWLGEELSLGGEIPPDVLPFGVSGPNQFVGVGAAGLLPKRVDIGDQDFFTMAFYLIVGPLFLMCPAIHLGILSTGIIYQGRNDVAIHGEGVGFLRQNASFPMG